MNESDRKYRKNNIKNRSLAHMQTSCCFPLIFKYFSNSSELAAHKIFYKADLYSKETKLSDTWCLGKKHFRMTSACCTGNELRLISSA